MSDIFSQLDALNLLKDKYILFLGSSNTRAMYKDLVWLLNSNTLIESRVLKTKLEKSFSNDTLKKGDHLHSGRDYIEVRDYQKDGVHLEFHFLTRCLTKSVVCMLEEMKGKPNSAPDVIAINSCLWDIARWGPNGVTEYRDNMVKLMKLLKSCLPSRTMVIWTTTQPVDQACRGGFLIKQVEFLNNSMQFELMEGNLFARDVVVAHGFDILDLHYSLRMQLHRRERDGVHWSPLPMRHMTNCLLTHIAVSWARPLPGNAAVPEPKEPWNFLRNTSVAEFKFPAMPQGLNKVAMKEPGNQRKKLNAMEQNQPKQKGRGHCSNQGQSIPDASHGSLLMDHPNWEQENPRSHSRKKGQGNYGQGSSAVAQAMNGGFEALWGHNFQYNIYGEVMLPGGGYNQQSGYNGGFGPTRQRATHRADRRANPYGNYYGYY